MDDSLPKERLADSLWASSSTFFDEMSGTKGWKDI
jgi:hypothetical protein